MNAPTWIAPPPAVTAEEGWLNRLFLQARTCNSWQARPVPIATLRRLYDLAKMGPTSANCSPARFVFVTSEQGKAKLLPHLSSANRAKTALAPVTVIIGQDRAFAERMPQLFPHAPAAAAWFADPGTARDTALRNSSLQGAYLMLAARALGLDCGPMSGFDQAGLDAAFFEGTEVTTNFICNLGFGSQDALRDRLPRLGFDEACRVE